MQTAPSILPAGWKFRILHGFHTHAELPPEKPITVKPADMLRTLWAVGLPSIVGAVRHSMMPQQVSVSASQDFYLKCLKAWQDFAGGTFVEVVGGEESNIRWNDNAGGPWPDDTWTQAPYRIYSVHCTEQCGWREQTPDMFYDAYINVLEAHNMNFPGSQAVLGHVMFYAQGESWTKRYASTIRLARAEHAVFGVSVQNVLRHKSVWERGDLFHPTDGLTVLQPWALTAVKATGVRLTLDWDAHTIEDIAGFNPLNLKLLVDVLAEMEILENFCELPIT